LPQLKGRGRVRFAGCKKNGPILAKSGQVKGENAAPLTKKKGVSTIAMLQLFTTYLRDQAAEILETLLPE
jgi:hypothetical protein